LRLLLDEMISPRIARELRNRGFDVQAIKNDRTDLASLADREIVKRIAAERRAIATNDVADYMPLHQAILARAGEHFGMLFTFDDTMPRHKKSTSLWVEALRAFLAQHPDENALRNRVRIIEPLP
jgi:predicted nuclease of predicted toxin-antitoxin system